MADEKYNHAEIEKKWQKRWADEGAFVTPDIPNRPKAYVLDMFPYPSGEGLHVGHPKGYIATDVYSRMKMMQGYDVLHPMGWDAFGLPAENYAIKNKVHPRVAVEKNIARFKEQLSKIGFTYDWSREINTTDPEYYKWTQWIFLQLYKKGLAYESFEPINWCPSCKTGLANEDLDQGKCERCGSVVEKRPMRQWVLKITDYAEKLLAGLKDLSWPESIKESQRNWIGKSEGAHIDFALAEDTPKHYVLLHGREGSPEANFFPWLKQELEKRGHTVEVPQLPHTNTPHWEEQADFVQKNCTLNENTVIVGHSFGGVVALRLLERGIKVQRVTLCATPFSGVFLDGIDRETVSDALKKKFDFSIITKNSKEFVVLSDSSDPVVPASDGEALSRGLNCILIRCKGQDEHFCAEKEPDILMASAPTIRVFTTRADTLFGCTYLVLSPEHPWVQLAIDENHDVLENKDEARAYVASASKKQDMDRTTEGKEKTGIALQGVQAINPATGKEIPIWIADYVLGNYGTGAVMAVPAHDERDMEFAQKYNLPAIHVVDDSNGLIDSGEYSGMQSADAKKKITEKFGTKTINYKLRDWVFSRQRYWGEPIPIILCSGCGVVPVPENQLPVLLPEVEHYEPTGTGESPLANITDWVSTVCPKCGGPAKRETNTMPQWAGSSWYHLRFIDPNNSEVFVDPEKEKAWMPVDVYVGGAEHATRHLIYARFWHIVLHELGYVSTSEPFVHLEHVGLILAEDGRKMSKRWGNVINPDDIVSSAGADTLRIYEMFMGPFNQAVTWSTASMSGPRRFLERVWRFTSAHHGTYSEDTPELISVLHQTIKRVSDDTQNFRFNTAIAGLMELLNVLEKEKSVSKNTLDTFLLILAPYAPHICEELWELIGNSGMILRHVWPVYDATLAQTGVMSLAIQVNGRVRGEMSASITATQDEVEAVARNLPNVAKYIADTAVKKIIYVPGKLISFVV